MSISLETQLREYGTPRMIDDTIRRIHEYTNWYDFANSYLGRRYVPQSFISPYRAQLRGNAMLGPTNMRLSGFE